MYYGGYAGDEGYVGDQGYAGDVGYGYQMQPMMPPYAACSYNPYGQQDFNAQVPPQMMMMAGGGGDPSRGQRVQGYVEPPSDERLGSSSLKSHKSFSGPPPGVERHQSMSRSRSIRSNKKEEASGMARHGSVFISNRERDTQVSISTRGGMSVHCMGDDAEDLKQYYGDMATRNEVRKMDGLKTVKSYRGDIAEGEDVGKPRRVTNRRNVNGRTATGYGGINFKRHAAMLNGEQWGDVEIRMRDGTGHHESDDLSPHQGEPMQPQVPMYQPPMFVPVIEEAPMMPQIYNKEDIHSYSNLSDAFSKEDEGDADL
ncbi:hypothetical protein ABL78_2824 [Leptomonas seymouri]|uniref:Uncharacterized protein n=1 Tax=Leptomonas seymouri TaxID=5684 RepID=A0A0N1HYS4_LEPSE|nr:hypothetical protein ABL78_2824 [Leptomonas seymouri]|eukprot:KPI88094.1 hypothetical protein ABL78_2824 [Leptomonas seymouri]